MGIFIQEIAAANRQNYRCKKCGRQFVEHSSQILVSEAQKSIVDKLLLEKISLSGISRLVEVSWEVKMETHLPSFETW